MNPAEVLQFKTKDSDNDESLVEEFRIIVANNGYLLIVLFYDDTEIKDVFENIDDVFKQIKSYF